MPIVSRRHFGLVAGAMLSFPAIANAAIRQTFSSKGPAMPTRFHTTTVQGVDIFYREAGPRDAPAIVLLHGYPTSSRMYRGLIPLLADRYRVIAPDYPGFGLSAVPARDEFTYSHAHLAEIISDLMTKLGVSRFGMYLMDFGGPIGYRIILKRANDFAGAILQNTPVFAEDASGKSWGPLGAYWKSGSTTDREAVRATLTLDNFRHQYLDGVKDPTLMDPLTWTTDYLLADREGVKDIMLDLLYDIRSNSAVLVEMSQFFAQNQKRFAIATGVNDPLFPGKSMRPPPEFHDIAFHPVDSGHFALEDKLDEIAPIARDFFQQTI